MKIEFINLLEESDEIQLKTRDWRNSPEVAKYFQIAFIDEKTHIDWLKSLRENPPKNIAFLIKFNQEYSGLIYFLKINYIAKEADIGIYIYNQNLRGKGIGQTAFEFAINYAREILKLSTIKLEVLKDNFNAIKLYENIGFKFIEQKNNEILIYKLFL